MARRGSDMHAERNLVEFYDHEHLENVISLLHGRYSGVTYVYFKHANEPDPWERQMLKEFIPKTFQTPVHFLEISENSITCALDAFRKLISAGGFYDFDITGGSSLFVAAVGTLFAEDGGCRMALHEYDVAKGTCSFCHPRDTALPLRKKPANLSVADVLSLREITVVNGGQSVYVRLKDEVLRREIVRLWSVMREHFHAWNEFCKIAAAYSFEGKCGVLVEKRMSSAQYDVVAVILRALKERGILTDLREQITGSGKKVTFRLQIRQEERFLYAKGGNLLEMLTSLAVVDSGVCSDCCTGITLDWENRGKETIPNPTNEIDVVAVRGHIPYFISCKNTAATKENLYEIMTMTRHFGGAYAVPVMVSTNIVTEAVQVRAKEMGVVLVDAVGEMSVEEFSQAMKKVIQRN